MPAKCPERRESRERDHGLVSLDDGVGRALSNEVDLNLTANCDEREGCSSILVELNHWGHSVRVSEVEASKHSSNLSLIENERMSA